MPLASIASPMFAGTLPLALFFLCGGAPEGACRCAPPLVLRMPFTAAAIFTTKDRNAPVLNGRP